MSSKDERDLQESAEELKRIAEDLTEGDAHFSEDALFGLEEAKAEEDINQESGEVERKGIRRVLSEAGDFIIINTPGMRILKTSITVILCFLFDFWRVAPNLYDSTVAAIVCLQNDIRSSWVTALNRVIATLVAGVYAAVFLEIFKVRVGLGVDDIGYFVLIGIAIIPLMQLLVMINRKGSVSLGAIVFVIVTVTSKGMTEPWMYVTHRVTNTIVGILIALLVNWFPPFNKLGQKLSRRKEEALEDYEKLRYEQELDKGLIGGEVRRIEKHAHDVIDADRNFEKLNEVGRQSRPKTHKDEQKNNR